MMEFMKKLLAILTIFVCIASAQAVGIKVKADRGTLEVALVDKGDSVTAEVVPGSKCQGDIKIHQEGKVLNIEHKKSCKEGGHVLVKVRERLDLDLNLGDGVVQFSDVQSVYETATSLDAKVKNGDIQSSSGKAAVTRTENQAGAEAKLAAAGKDQGIKVKIRVKNGLISL
jgi:hypothetical protein